MQKIYTRIESQWDNVKQRYVTTDADFYWYGGKVAHAKGGGQSVQQIPSSQTTSQVQVSEPWAPQIPYLTRGFSEAENLFLDKSAPGFYPKPMTTPFTPEKETALQLQALRATTGSPLQPLSNMQGLLTLGGGYLPSKNPYDTTLNEEFELPINSERFNNAIGSATRKIIPQVDSVFERSGRTGSGLAQQAKTQAISDAFADTYLQEKALTQQDRVARGQNYTNERENMMRALMFAPTLAASDYADFAALSEVGDVRQAYDDAAKSEDIARYDYSQNIRQKQLQDYMALINGNYGGTSTMTGTQMGSQGQLMPTSNPVAGGVGGALAGANLASKLGGIPGMSWAGGPWGMAAGAGLGLIGSFF
jgi:hypothetical protein